MATHFSATITAILSAKAAAKLRSCHVVSEKVCDGIKTNSSGCLGWFCIITKGSLFIA
ncbi:MAG: hypothetical protein ACI9QV_000880 [Methylophagaceae bacterium]|jgi:hypothetical protein